MALLAEPSDLEVYGEEGLTAERATALLEGASAMVRSYCDWSLTRAAETFVLDGTGERVLFLPTLHLVDVTAVRVNGAPVTGWSWSASGVVEGPFPRGRRNVEVDAVHGYDVVPHDLREVTCAMALRSHLNPAGAQGETVGGDSVAWGRIGSGFTVTERQVLDRYRLTGQP